MCIPRKHKKQNFQKMCFIYYNFFFFFFADGTFPHRQIITAYDIPCGGQDVGMWALFPSTLEQSDLQVEAWLPPTLQVTLPKLRPCGLVWFGGGGTCTLSHPYLVNQVACLQNSLILTSYPLKGGQCLQGNA